MTVTLGDDMVNLSDQPNGLIYYKERQCCDDEILIDKNKNVYALIYDLDNKQKLKLIYIFIFFYGTSILKPGDNITLFLLWERGEKPKEPKVQQKQ